MNNANSVDEDSLEYWMDSEEITLGKVMLPEIETREWLIAHGWENSVVVHSSNLPYHACFVSVHRDVEWFKRRAAELNFEIMWQ